MADNFKMMALHAPPQCSVSMGFRFQGNLPIDEFLAKVNIPRIFSGASYWQGAKFCFRVRGINNDNYLIERDIYVPVNLIHFNVKQVSYALMSQYVRETGWFFTEPPFVISMSVWFV
jgi:hypothetical protein